MPSSDALTTLKAWQNTDTGMLIEGEWSSGAEFTFNFEGRIVLAEKDRVTIAGLGESSCGTGPNHFASFSLQEAKPSVCGPSEIHLTLKSGSLLVLKAVRQLEEESSVSYSPD